VPSFRRGRGRVGWRLVSRGGDGRRHVHGGSRLLAALGCDLLRWLEVVEGWAGRLGRVAWWVGCLLGPDVELGADVACAYWVRDLCACQEN
jgi:hypothetical protein